MNAERKFSDKEIESMEEKVDQPISLDVAEEDL